MSSVMIATSDLDNLKCVPLRAIQGLPLLVGLQDTSSNISLDRTNEGRDENF